MKYKNEFKWIKDLQKNGYNYMIMPKNRQRSFYASKTVNKTKAGEFYKTSIWDEFKLESGEEWIPGKDTKGGFIKL